MMCNPHRIFARTSIAFRLVALLAACNYAAFRIEPFEEEYEAHHPPLSTSPTIALPSLHWETYDKDNAPKAFAFSIEIVTVRFGVMPEIRISNSPLYSFPLPIRDKSPPA